MTFAIHICIDQALPEAHSVLGWLQLPPVDKAVTHLCLAKAAVALFELYLQTTGTPTQGHSIQEEKVWLMHCWLRVILQQLLCNMI